MAAAGMKPPVSNPAASNPAASKPPASRPPIGKPLAGMPLTGMALGGKAPMDQQSTSAASMASSEARTQPTVASMMQS